MKASYPVAGVDFGSKLSGHTVIAWVEADSLTVNWKRSLKGKSADDFLLNLIQDLKPYILGIDAPLSLPGIYRWPTDYDDYFYRISDRTAGAMSPMFIGGLTARAIKLKTAVENSVSSQVVEVYPKLMARQWSLDGAGYKKSGGNMHLACDIITQHTAWEIPDGEISWHHIDALLALASSMRVSNGIANTIGDPREGAITY
ncbi:hypothetical protein AB9P05_10265 [Roseivirga sp. BDSF3-8]|uniref:hypothetical protein n=1 Tax=Roseivirga sp. BDSF3-8 TaxID=3241598 RepID=UPI00353231CF